MRQAHAPQCPDVTITHSARRSTIRHRTATVRERAYSVEPIAQETVAQCDKPTFHSVPIALTA